MLLDGFHNVRPGGRYVDFEVPDLEGNKVRLSDIIKGKIAVLICGLPGVCLVGQRRKR